MSEINASFNEKLYDMTKNSGCKVVLPEGNCKRILDAGKLCAIKNVCEVIVLVDDLNNVDSSYLNIKNLTFLEYRKHEIKDVLKSALFVKRQSKGVTEEDAENLIKNPVYFASMMVDLGFADGYVCGAEVTTANSLKPALQLIKSKSGLVSSFFIMEKGKDVFALGDCALIPNPTSEELKQIAINTANGFSLISKEMPKVALLSYSTMGSAKGDNVSKIQDAVKLLENENVNFEFDGEMQLDCAVNADVAKLKAPKSKVAGNANVLVFPNLESGNIGYKIMQRFGGFNAIGPICSGFNKPVNDISRGANVNEIAGIIAVTVLQILQN